MTSAAVRGTAQKLLAQFVEACEVFEKLDAEPDTENIFMPNINAIRSQKGVYAQVLQKIAQTKIYDGEIENPYERSSSMLANIGDVRNRILKTNTAFKQVIYAYARHTSKFKSLIAEMERQETTLGNEIMRVKDRYEVYATIKSDISRLLDLSLEIASTRKFLDASSNAQGHADPGIEEHENELAGDMESEKENLAKIKKELSSAQGAIASLLLPLHRPSKKFDYMSAGKIKFVDYLSDPIERIRDESDLRTVLNLSGALKEAIGSGRVDVKDRDGVIKEIDAMMPTDMLAIINDVRRLREDEAQAQRKIKALQAQISSLQAKEAQIERDAGDKVKLSKRLEEFGSVRDSLRLKIERQFKDIYRREIKVVWDA